MTRKMIIQNIMLNYKQYGITEPMINELIDDGIKAGQTLEAIYVGIKLGISNMYDTDENFTIEDVMLATGASREEVLQAIEEGTEELKSAGENPDKYFIKCESVKYMM